MESKRLKKYYEHAGIVTFPRNFQITGVDFATTHIKSVNGLSRLGLNIVRKLITKLIQSPIGTESTKAASFDVFQYSR